MNKITWFVKDGGGYTSKQDHHAGTYRKNEPIVFDIQVWNNRWGVKDEASISVPVLSFHFGHFEDSSLLERVKIIVDERNEMPVVVKSNKGTVVLSRALSGKANDGDEESRNSAQNFVNFRMEIDTKGAELKENDLKKLYFEINELN